MRDGRLVAQDIELVLDGGAYTTLTPVVLSPGDDPRRRPVRRPERPHPEPGGRHEHAAQRRLPRLRRAAVASSRPRPSSTGSPRRSASRRSRCAGGTSTGSAGMTPTMPGPARRRRRRGGPRPGGGGGRVRPRSSADGSARAGRTGRDRTARAGIGLALAWHGAGFTGSGEARLGSVVEPRADGRGRHPDPDRDRPRWARARRRSSRSSSPRSWACRRRRRHRAAGHADRARLRPDGRLAHGDGRRRHGDQGRPAAASRGRGAHRPVVRGELSRRRGRPWQRHRGRRSVRAVSRASASTTRPTPATPTRLSAGRPRSPRSRSISTRARSPCCRSSRSTTSGRVIHPVLCEGQVEGGTLQAVGYATIEEIKLRDGRYLNDRLQTYIIPTALDAPRIETILVEAPFADAPHGAKGVGELPMDVGAPAVVAAIHDATGAWIHDLPAIAGADHGRPGRDRATRAARHLADDLAARPSMTSPPSSTCARDAPAARRAPRGPRADRHEGGLRRGRVRRVHGADRRRGRGQLPRPGLPGRRRNRSGPSRGSARARTATGSRGSGRSSARSSRPAAPSAGSARPGMLMAGDAFLASGAAPTDEAIREAIAGNLCRCTGLHEDRRGDRPGRELAVSGRGFGAPTGY